MPFGAGKAARARPPSVAIHDDGKMAWHGASVHAVPQRLAIQHRHSSDGEDFLLLDSKHSVDVGDDLIGCLLHLFGLSLSFLLADLVILLQLLENIEPVTPYMPHRDTRSLCVFMSDLHQLATPFLIQLRNAQPQDLSFRCGSESEVRCSNRLLHGMNHAAVPGLDGNQTGLGYAHS